MTIFLNLYIVTYLLTLIKINYLLTNQLFNKGNNLSLNTLITYIIKFNKFSNTILILFLSLAGLPPFFMFFIKFNFLINILYKTNIFIIFTIFIIFFLNMIFYIQIFFNKNTYVQLNYTKNNKKIIKVNYLFIINFYLIINFLAPLFFSDFYYILLMCL